MYSAEVLHLELVRKSLSPQLLTVRAMFANDHVLNHCFSTPIMNGFMNHYGETNVRRHEHKVLGLVTIVLPIKF